VNLPFWLESANARRTPSAWVVNLRARTHSIGCGNRDAATVRIPNQRGCETEFNAICYASSLPTARKLRTVARGCWIMAQLKERWDVATRHDILGGLAKQMRAKYDGISYLYESDEAQDELIRLFKLQDIIVPNFLPIAQAEGRQP